MSEQVDFTELAQRAQQGDVGALDSLAELAAKRLRVYVYRLTFQEDLTAEIVQETMLEMCRVLAKLKHTDRFLPWLYGIATNKLRHYYRSEQTMKRATASRSEIQRPSETQHEGLENLVSQELKEIVSGAIQSLKTRHRAVLVMRCYDGMSYAEIAESMGSSEFGTRMLFMRAKKALQKQLSRQGLGRGTFVAVLVLFGKMTAPSPAAAAQVAVSATTLNAGLAATVAGVITSKAAVVSLAAGILTVGTAVGPLGLGGAGRSLPEPVVRTSVSAIGATAEEAVEQQWYFLPDGSRGSLLLRAQGNREDGRPAWVVLQNAEANYYYNGQEVQINDARWYSPTGQVMRLPQDPPRLRSFLDSVEGVRTGLPYAKVSGKGALIEAFRDGDAYAVPTVSYNRNVPQEDFFLSDWSSGLPIVDNRDLMHKRGWTYFNIEGQVYGHIVKGSGYLPLSYQASQERQPWLSMRVGSVKLWDSSQGAWMSDSADNQRFCYPQGTLFSGLSRPWTGLHTLDTIRRDAGSQGLRFETLMDTPHETAQVLVYMDTLTVTYHVDLSHDLLRRVTLNDGDDAVGDLLFSYGAEAGRSAREIAHPDSQASNNPVLSPGVRWLEDLAENHLNQ